MRANSLYHRKVLSVTIVGVYRAPPLMPASAQQGIFLPVELMKEIPGIYLESALNQLKSGSNPTTQSYASVTVRVRDPSDLDGVEKAIRNMGYRTETVLSKLQHMRRFFLAIQLLLTVVGSIALGIAALGIVNTLLMAVLERYQEIGLCKAIGASDGDLFVLFVTEAAIIGFLGGLTGVALGWLMSCGMEVLASVYARRHEIAGNLDLFAFPFWLLAASIGFAIVVSMAAGIYPALRAARSIRSAPCGRIDATGPNEGMPPSRSLWRRADGMPFRAASEIHYFSALLSLALSALAFSALALQAGHWQPGGHLPACALPLPALLQGPTPCFFMCSAACLQSFCATFQTSSAEASQRTRTVLSFVVVFRPSTSFMTSASPENFKEARALKPSLMACTWRRRLGRLHHQPGAIERLAVMLAQGDAERLGLLEHRAPRLWRNGGRSGQQARARRDAPAQRRLRVGDARRLAVQHVQRRGDPLRVGREDQHVGLEERAGGRMGLRTVLLRPGVDVERTVLRRLVVGGLLGFLQQQLLIHRRENNGHTMGLVGVGTVKGNAVKVLAEIDADLVANHVKMLARILQQRARFECLLHDLRVADGVNIDVDDPLGVGRDVL